MSEIKEEWRPVVGYEGLYEVSNLGRVKSLDRVVTGKNGGQYPFKGKILKQRNDKDGYLTVYLCGNGKDKLKKVHRLVGETFLPNTDNLPVINHKDENKLNNCVDNLEWCTVCYNNTYGTRTEKISRKLINGKKSKQVYQYNLEGELVNIWPSINETGRNGFNIGCVNGCCLGKKNYKTHKKYIWRYAD